MFQFFARENAAFLFFRSRNHEKDGGGRATDQQKAVQGLDTGQKTQMARGIDIAKAEGRIVDQGKIEDIHERVDVFLFEAADTHQFTDTETEGVKAGFDYVGGLQGIEGK